MRMPPRACALALVLALPGCVTLPAGSGVAELPPQRRAAAEQAQSAREARLGLARGQACDAPDWQLLGRVALSNGRQGGSGRLEWTQGQGRTEVTLSAPITRQSWTLTAQGGEAVLNGVPNGPLQGSDAGALLRQATGWDIPVAALGCWVRGARADVARFGPAVLGFDAAGRLRRIEQAGWRIDYPDWPAVAELPPRVNAVRGSDEVRLVIDSWSAASP